MARLNEKELREYYVNEMGNQIKADFFIMFLGIVFTLFFTYLAYRIEWATASEHYFAFGVYIFIYAFSIFCIIFGIYQWRDSKKQLMENIVEDTKNDGSK